jgi:hypothetical protein
LVYYDANDQTRPLKLFLANQTDVPIPYENDRLKEKENLDIGGSFIKFTELGLVMKKYQELLINV